MTVLMEDVHDEVGNKRWSKAATELGDTKLLYADDTMLIGSDSKALQCLLQTIEKHSTRYGLRLNKGKCEMIAVNNKQKPIKFANGQEVKKVQQATHLGANVDPRGYRTELESRIQ